jgi:hypothetical protein
MTPTRTGRRAIGAPATRDALPNQSRVRKINTSGGELARTRELADPVGSYPERAAAWGDRERQPQTALAVVAVLEDDSAPRSPSANRRPCSHEGPSSASCRDRRHQDGVLADGLVPLFPAHPAAIVAF